MSTGFERVPDETLRKMLTACGAVSRGVTDPAMLGSISAIVVKIHEELRERHGAECYCRACLPVPVQVWG